MNHWITSLRMILFMTVLTGGIYTGAVTVVSQALFSHEANGSLIQSGDKVVGSELVGQKFEGERYFWPRPSAGDYNPLPSGGTNLGQISADLKTKVDERKAKLKANHPESQTEPPQDLLFASSSGLDPHISPAAAEFQVTRIAKTRGMDVQKVRALVDSVKENRQWGFLGEPRVNVLKLNLALDENK